MKTLLKALVFSGIMIYAIMLENSRERTLKLKKLPATTRGRR